MFLSNCFLVSELLLRLMRLGAAFWGSGLLLSKFPKFFTSFSLRSSGLSTIYFFINFGVKSAGELTIACFVLIGYYGLRLVVVFGDKCLNIADYIFFYCLIWRNHKPTHSSKKKFWCVAIYLSINFNLLDKYMNDS